MSLVDSARHAVANLSGLFLLRTNFAADLRGFGFRSEHDDNDEFREWRLHIQCPWRISESGRIITGDSDWWDPVDPNEAGSNTGDPATGGSVQALRIGTFFEKYQSPLKFPNLRLDPLLSVISTYVGELGDLRVDFRSGFSLEVFPTASRGESWRIFKRHDEGSHFVWTPQEVG